jgi:hypothetical protein
MGLRHDGYFGHRGTVEWWEWMLLAVWGPGAAIGLLLAVIFALMTVTDRTGSHSDSPSESSTMAEHPS